MDVTRTNYSTCQTPELYLNGDKFYGDKFKSRKIKQQDLIWAVQLEQVEIR